MAGGSSALAAGAWMGSARDDALFGTLDHRGRFVTLAGPVERILGWRADELTGVCAMKILAPASRAQVTSFWQAVRAMGEIGGQRLRVVRRDGRPAVFDVGVSLLAQGDPRDGAAAFLAQPATLRDELSFWRAEATRRRMTARLAADAAHEVNNPLQALLVYAAVLRNSPSLDAGPLRAELAERLREATHRIRETSRLVRQLRRRFEGIARPLRLDPLVTDGLALVSTGARRRGVRFSTRLGGEGVRLSGPAAPLVDAVIAVLDLAVHVAAPGTVIDVSTRWLADRRCQRLELHVRHDALDGAHDLAHALGTPSRRPPAAGFSAEVLHLLFQLTRRCHALLEVSSALGFGTRLSLEMPARHGGEPDADSPAAPSGEAA